MAWNEPGGNGDKDPWGNRGGNQGPPDLDEVFRNIQKKFGSLFGGKAGRRGAGSPSMGGGKGLGLIAVLIVLAWIASGLYEVEQAEVGIVLLFGEHVDTTQPGLHWIARPFESVELVNIAERRQIPFKGTVLTQDENIIDLQGTLQYQIVDAEKYLFNVRDPDISLSQAVESALRLNVGQSQMDYIITEGRDEIANRIKTTVQAIVDSYGTGLSVIEVNIQDVNPPDPVREAFQDVIQAREDKQRSINEAEAYRNEVVPKARGAAARMREEADAYKQEVVARAEGETSRFVNLLKEYKKAPDVTRDRLYLDMMESVLTNSSKVMVDVKGGNNLLYLPLDKLMQRNDTDTDSVSVPDSLKDLQQRELKRRKTQNDTSGDLRKRETR
jgi:modulator of FtsH protease HflK